MLLSFFSYIYRSINQPGHCVGSSLTTAAADVDGSLTTADGVGTIPLPFCSLLLFVQQPCSLKLIVVLVWAAETVEKATMTGMLPFAITAAVLAL
jgi:hypothetical protein